ncbi:hypothetical protein FPV67DRAFT_1497676 [Lyophyllum atratum]|nr:hypothetical protein FPV67DRAFT_1497676 [Lyophyllum atratum]
MSRTGFDNKTRAQMAVAQHDSVYHRSTRQDGRDERGSMSGSEDGSYAPYQEVGKGELEIEDGTPKRPMNAFMIFARRRRPQVSSENQAMRTGEISKILSKEWNSMQTVEKQFYQDQARQLKDTFNTKYPDYVYRRRPNNSRRKRKPDAPGMRSSDAHSASEDVNFEDAGDSPTDAEDIQMPDSLSDIAQSCPNHEVLAYPDQTKFRPTSNRASPYAYPTHEHPLRSNAVHENRQSYESSSGGDRMLHDTSTGQVSQSYSYLTPQGQVRTQSRAIPIYAQTSASSTENWNLPSARPSSWLGPSEQSDRSFSSHTTSKVHRTSISPTWQRMSASSLPVNLPTLSSPFFPPDSTQESVSPSSHPQSITPSSYTSGSMQPPLLPVGRDYDTSQLSLSPSNPAHPYHSNAGRDGMMYAHRQPGTPRVLPAISNYSQSQPSQFSTNSGLGDPQGYWPRD